MSYYTFMFYNVDYLTLHHTSPASTLKDLQNSLKAKLFHTKCPEALLCVKANVIGLICPQVFLPTLSKSNTEN